MVACFYFIQVRYNEHKNEGKKRGGGFSKLCSLSPQLQAFIGVPELARTEVCLKSSGDATFYFAFI